MTRKTEDGEDEELVLIPLLGVYVRAGDTQEAQTRSTHTEKTMAGIALPIDESYKTSKS